MFQLQNTNWFLNRQQNSTIFKSMVVNVKLHQCCLKAFGSLTCLSLGHFVVCLGISSYIILLQLFRGNNDSKAK